MATKNKSKYSSNQYLSQTIGSFDKAVKLIIGHSARISAALEANPTDPDYIMMNARTAPAAADASAKYIAFNSVGGLQKGASVKVDIELATIKGSQGCARDWYNRTAAIYAKDDKPRMKAIWSKGLKPFRGKRDNVIIALKTLSDNIGADTNALMIAMKAEIDGKYLIINPDRTTQITAIGATGMSSKSLKASCISAMKIEYQNSGVFMNKFPDNINDIQESFHDMELLLDKQQMLFNPTLNADKIKDMAKRTLVFNSRFRCVAKGGEVWVYLSSTAGGTDSLPVKVLNGVPKEFMAKEFGITDYGQHCHITLVNKAGVKVSFLLQMY